MKVGRSRRPGVSPLIATIILIAITIVGGLLVYTILTGYISKYSGDDGITVSAIQLTVAPPAGANDGPGILSLTVKDTGNTPVTILRVSLLNGTSVLGLSSVSLQDALQTNSTGGLQPGLETSGTFYVCSGIQPSGWTGSCSGGSPEAEFGLDGSYSYDIVATFSDGSTMAVTGSVLASS